MNRRSRRSYLTALSGATAAAVAGCLGDGETGSPARTDTPTGTSTTTRTSPPTETPTWSPPRLFLEAVTDVEQAAADGPLTVYPGALRHWLLRAANTGETVRGHDEGYVYAPDPVLPRFETVQLTGTDVDGTYDLTAEGGIRYDLLVGADPVDPPADATVTPVEELPDERREFARTAIDPGERATVYPETELGEWVRHRFFGGYFEDGGETYLGKEVQQTDAAFFSTTAWYVLALSPTDQDPAVTLGLSDLDPAVTEAVDVALEKLQEGTTRVTYEGELTDAVVEFAAETSYLLTHDWVYAISVE